MCDERRVVLISKLVLPGAMVALPSFIKSVLMDQVEAGLTLETDVNVGLFAFSSKPNNFQRV